jgi:hypothetical protein
VRAVVEPMAISERLGSARICDLEIGFSARNGEEWDRMINALDAFASGERSVLAVHVRRDRPQSLRRLGIEGVSGDGGVVDIRFLAVLKVPAADAVELLPAHHGWTPIRAWQR